MFGKSDYIKFFSIALVACCAAFVCLMFLNYNLDISAAEESITAAGGKELFDALVTGGKITAAISGGCLILTAFILTAFYVKNLIDERGKELGVLKALGLSDIKIARSFYVFGLTVFVGLAVGVALSYAYLPHFYKVQNSEGYFPEITPKFHLGLTLCLTVLPACVFAVLSVLYACIKLKRPALDLIKERRNIKFKHVEIDAQADFIKSLKKGNLKSRKILVFFVAFSAFCFSAMTQMSFSMGDIASEEMGVLILVIGMLMAVLTLVLSLSSVVKGNTKTMAIMRVLGYECKEINAAILGGYRVFSYIGFILGTLYQFGLLKLMVDVIYAGLSDIKYSFNFLGLAVSFVLFVLFYELMMLLYAKKVSKLPLKSVMLET